MTEKPTCQTCTLKPCPHFSEMVHENDTAYFIMDIIRKVGCLSHPGAREYLMAPVIKELESHCVSGDSIWAHYSPNEIIALIRDGVK